jgi:DNA invertase Pin-like site-specific DNA recombinase
MESKSIRVLMYLRISCKKQQEEGHNGLKSQENSCRVWCQENGLHIHRVIREIASAKTGEKQVLLRDFIDENLSESKYEWKIIVFRADRLFRSTSFFLQILPIFIENNTSVISVIEGCLNYNQLLEKVDEAKKELDTLTSRIKSGLENRKMLGLPIGKPSFGFKRSQNKTENEIDEETYWIALYIQQLRDYNLSLNQVSSMFDISFDNSTDDEISWSFNDIANILNKAKIHNPKGKNHWTGSMIRSIYQSFIKNNEEDQFVMN